MFDGLSRRGFNQGVVAAAATAGAPRAVQAQRRGGDVVVAQQAQPPTLDGMTSLAQATRNIALHTFEMLVTRDERANPVPDLAESYVISPDGRTVVFTLRKGVHFHNGKEMTS